MVLFLLIKEEQKHIQAYVDMHNVKVNILHDKLTCKFRVDGKCSIYPVRPMLCRLIGVTKGMKCKYGNTAEIDGKIYLSFKTIGLLNDVIKN